MPRVIHVLRKFDPREWGGIETHLAGLVPALSRLGWESEVHAPAEDGTDGAPLEALGARFRTFRAFYPYLALRPEQRRDLVAAGGNLVAPGELASLLGSEADVLHTHTLRRLGGVVRSAARLRGRPYAVTVHGPVHTDPGIERDAAARTRGARDLGAPFGLLVGARRVIDDADLVFVLNGEEHRALLPVRGDRHLAHVAHGVELSRASTSARAAARESIAGLGAAPYAVVLARIDPMKSQETAIAAFLAAAPREMHLLLVGAFVDRAYERRLRALANDEPRVHFVGGVSPSRARALLAEAHLALIPSRAEPFGIVLLEAWAEGTPALVADVGGLSDLCRGNGAEAALVTSGEDWSARLAAALSDAAFLERERVEGPRRVAARYSWDALARRTVDAYARSAARRPAQ